LQEWAQRPLVRFWRNVAEAARRLGISRATLYQKISPQKSGDK
jgi:transcriptional regulator of acetoin/glycerol metabolism